MTLPPRHRILAIDDTEDTLELIRLTLQDDYDVLSLADPMNAYEYVDLFEPDLLILDIMMPRVSGFQILEMIQQGSRPRELPVILLSAKTASSDIKHGYQLGASLYLTKPFQPERLRKNVRLQFEFHPPTSEPHTQDLAAILKHIRQKTGYRQGGVQLASAVLPDHDFGGSSAAG
ncbi:MAG: response regulator [Sumerlaeia bacterium]